MIKILYIVDTIASLTAGTERQLAQLIKHLERDKFEPHLLALRPSPWLDQKYFPCPLHTLNLGKLLSYSGYRKYLELSRFIPTGNFHIVQTFIADANIFGVLAAHRAGCRVIISSRRNNGFFYTPHVLWATKYANRHVASFLVNSDHVIDDLCKKEGISPERFDVIYNGIDPTRLQANEENLLEAHGILSAIKATRIIGIVANLRPVKDLSCFIRAAAIIAKQRDDTGFVIIGSGDSGLKANLEQLASGLGLKNKLLFLGAIDNPFPFLRCFDVGVLTSRAEGLSNTLIEYGAAGLPAVATDVGGNREVVADGRTGYIVPAGSCEKVAEAVLRLLSDDNTRREMGENARKSIMTRFDLMAGIKLHQALYTRLYDRVAMQEKGR